MISFISYIEIISLVIPDSKIFFSTAASVADSAGVNLNGIKTLLVNDLSKFLIKGKASFSNGLKSLPTILGKIFGTKHRNPVKLDRTRKV